MVETPENQPEPVEVQEQDEEKKDGPGFQRYVMLGAGGLIGAMALIFLSGVVFVLVSGSEATANRIGMVRDLFIIILTLEFVLVIIALVVLILQVARLIATIQDEVKPILSDTRETMDTAKGTAQFVGQNVTRPVINASAFMAGAFAFAREIGGIRRAIRRDPHSHEAEAHDE